MATTLIRRGSKISKYMQCLSHAHARNNQHLAPAGQIDEDAHYPEVKPKYPPGKWGKMKRRIAWMWSNEGEEIARYRTYEEKLDFLTQYKYKVWLYNSVETTPNLMDYKCAVTKTKVMDNIGLPRAYDSVDIDIEFGLLKPLVIEVLEQAEDMNRDHFKEKVVQSMLRTPGNRSLEVDYRLSRLVVKTMLMNILGSLGVRHEHVINSRLDEDSTIAAFWVRDGMERFPLKKKVPETYIRQEKATLCGEQNVDFQIRKDKPLPEFAPVTDNVCLDGRYKKDMLEYSPRVLGQFSDHVDRKIKPGYNVGDPCRFTHLNFIFPNTKAMNLVSRYGEPYRLDAESGYLLSTGYLSTLAQAHSLGFNQYEELTYPLTTQTILTDGQNYTLSAYQLNTVQLWKDDKANNLQNVMWKTSSTKLYECFENGKVVGFNDDLFKLLLKFFLIAPSDRNGIDLSPNIDSYPSPVDIKNRKIFSYVQEPISYEK